MTTSLSPHKRNFSCFHSSSRLSRYLPKLLLLHETKTSGSGCRFGLNQGQQFPVHHYYLRGLDDLLLKEGCVVKRTLAQISGRKPVNLSGDADSLKFPSRHDRVAFL